MADVSEDLIASIISPPYYYYYYYYYYYCDNGVSKVL
jgi:hypothetical protein